MLFSRSLCNFLDVIYLVLSLCDGAHFDACVIVVVDRAKVRPKFLVEYVRSQVVLFLDESQVLSVMSRNSFMHLFKEAFCTLMPIACACDEADKDDIKEDMALE